MNTISYKVNEITKCRVCKNTQLVPIMSLGNQFVSNFVDSADRPLIRAPLDLLLCDVQNGGCGLLQLKHSVNADEMYEQYWYRSGINQSMRDALADIVQNAKEFVPLKAEDLVLDIGCNDGTLLRAYNVPGLKLIGFDPAKNLLEYSSKGTTRIFDDFFNASTFKKAFPNEKAKIVTSIAMFYDLEDPNQFVADIQEILDEDGVWIIQMNYLGTMIEDNVFDNICHEHLEYYSMASLEALLFRHQLKIVDVKTNGVNGGSFRIFISHAKSTEKVQIDGSKERVEKLRKAEASLGLTDLKTFKEFAKRAEKLRSVCVEFVQKEAKAGKKIFVYGASTKGNVILQYYGLDHSILIAAADRNPDKAGKKMVGGFVPIVTEETARKQNPDYFLVLPWFFIKEFVVREQEFLQRGGKFIVPLPEFRIIDKTNWKNELNPTEQKTV